MYFRPYSESNLSSVEISLSFYLIWNSSVIRQKGESQDRCFKKTKHARFSEKRTFLTLWYAHLRVSWNTLWPYYRRIIFCFCQETISQSMTMKSIISTCKWTRCLWLVFWFVIRTLAVYGNSYLCNSMGLSNTWLLEFQYPILYFLILLVNTHQNKLVYQNK